MVRQTSIEAYNEIRESGVLGKLQWQVYQALYEHGPMTERELYERFFTAYQRPSITPRLSELQAMRRIRAVEVREDHITGRHCISWDVTDEFGVPLPVKETKDQIIARQALRIAELEAQVATLSKRGQMSLL
jgi:hypothetical protein